MKRLLIIIAALLAFAGCSHDDISETPVSPLIGEWKSTGSTSIYISFAGDGTFELYQHLREGVYELYRGSWELDGQNVLSGTYNDSEEWSSDYSVVLHDKLLTLTSEDGETTVYAACTIPDVIKETCIVRVKSSGDPL